jgi:hypothetical protein
LQRPLSNANTAVEELRLALEELKNVLVRSAGDANKITNLHFFKADYVDRFTNECRKINPLLEHIGDIIRQIGPSEFTGATASAVLQLQEQCLLVVSNVDTSDLLPTNRDKTHSTKISNIDTATSRCLIAKKCLDQQLSQIRNEYHDVHFLMRKMLRKI